MAGCSAGTGGELLDWRRGIDGALHLNAAGASPPHWRAAEAVAAHLSLERERGGYQAAEAARGGNAARQALSQLLHCQPEEVALQESAQLAWAKAFYSLDLREGDALLAFESEYAGNAVAMLQRCRKTGARLQVLPHRPSGLIDLDALRDALRRAKGSASRCVVALTHMNTGSAVIQPAEEVGVVAREFGAVYLLDACQTIGQIDVDVRAIGCDFACGTGRKWLRGPRGSGFLYASREATDAADANFAQTASNYGSGAEAVTYLPPDCSVDKRRASLFGEPVMLDHVSGLWQSRDTYTLAPGARRFEMWEASEANRCGLAAAVSVALVVTPSRIHAISSHLASLLRRRLVELVPGVRLRDGSARSANGAPLGAIVAFEVEGVSSAALAECLKAQALDCSLSPSSHTFKDQQWTQQPSIRLSPSYFNTTDEVETAAQMVAVQVARLRLGA